jgi:dUTPase
MFKVLDEACQPTRGSKYSACVDLYAREDVAIGAGETKLIPLGVKIDEGEIHRMFSQECFDNFGAEVYGRLQDNELLYYEKKFKKSHYLQLMLRSSLGKQGLILPNGVGIIDLDYKDEIMMIIHNPVPHNVSIKKGQKIAQITLLEHKSSLFGIETEEERSGGFGSTGA